jgi:DNA-directed RNA polymerase subunit RPC12/RpoP
MDVTFPCTHCQQILEADASLAGTQIECPSCGKHLVIPHPDLTNVKLLNPIASSAGAKEEKHFSVPVREGPSEVLIQKPAEVQDVVPQDGKPHLRIKTIRRIDCVEVGHDRFDEVVTRFLDKVGQDNVVTVNTVAYTHIDIGSQKLLTDFGILILYRA